MTWHGRTWRWASGIAVSLILAGDAVAMASAQPVATHSAVAGSPRFTVNGDLYGVAATSARNAWAVGMTGGGNALILHWNGKSWRRVASPGPAGVTLRAVAATSARNAWAVGDLASGKPLILHWNGRAWKRVACPSPAGAILGLSGVAATSARNAWAVGETLTGTLIARWNGKSWRRVASPSPAESPALTKEHVSKPTVA